VRSLVIFIIGFLSLSGCGKDEPETAETGGTIQEAKEESQTFSMESLASGARVFQEHCAQCHGPDAQGHPDWERLSKTNFPAAPPLDGSGNDWKRKKQELVAAITNGITRNGLPVMPGWKGRLSDQEIEDVIVWFQALWPEDVYDRWRKANASATSTKG